MSGGDGVGVHGCWYNQDHIRSENFPKRQSPLLQETVDRKEGLINKLTSKQQLHKQQLPESSTTRRKMLRGGQKERTKRGKGLEDLQLSLGNHVSWK